MAGLDLKGLIGKLNPVCQRALEGAAGLCLSRTNYNVEVEHWLTKLLEQPGNDICLLLKAFDIDQGRVLTDLTKAIDRLKTGNARPPLLSPEVCDLIKQAWLIASVDFGDEKVRGAWLLLALLSDESLSQRLLAASDEFRRISPDVLRREASRVFPRSTESDFMPGGAASGDAPAGGAAAGADGKPRGAWAMTLRGLAFGIVLSILWEGFEAATNLIGNWTDTWTDVALTTLGATLAAMASAGQPLASAHDGVPRNGAMGPPA